jgi:hypothetical protein
MLMAAELSLSRGEPCTGCGAQVGREHSAGCLEMHCPRTGLSQGLCPGLHSHSGGGVWTGLLPGEEAAVAFGWFAALRHGQGWVPVAPRADVLDYGTDYMPDLNRVYSQACWHPTTQEWAKPPAADESPGTDGGSRPRPGQALPHERKD